MKIDKIFDNYILFKMDTIKPSTLEIYLLIIKNLKVVFEQMHFKSIIKFDNQLLLLILSKLKNDYRSNTYINRHILFMIDALNYNKIKITASFKKLKVEDHSFDRFYPENLKKIIDVLNKRNHTKNSLVYKTLVFLLLDSGCRIGEALSIKISNISFEKPYRIVLENTKTMRKRIVPFSDFSYDHLKQLISYKQRELLFYNFLKDRPLTKHDVRMFYRNLRKWTGIERIHSHMFRKTFASLLLENGMPVEMLQILLGHSRITTTMIYAIFNSTRAIEQYQTYNGWHIKKED